MLLGGSPVSLSATLAATTVTVQTSPVVAKSTVGLRVKVVGPPERAKACAPEVAQEMVKALDAAVTASSKVTVTSVLLATPVAPLVGVVEETDGGLSTVKEKT